jgi:transcriptional regulator with XRE-family HTH domain
MSAARPSLAPRAALQAGALTKATLRAAALLGLKDAELARVIGVSPASLSRLHRDRTIPPEGKEGELAILLVRLYRSLDGVLGGQQEAMRRWFQAENLHLGGVPARLVQTVPGLVHVLQYLDAMRAKN